MSVILASLFFILLALSFPVSHALIYGATAGVLSSSTFRSLESSSSYFPNAELSPDCDLLLVMAAELMMTGKLGKHLIDFATDLVGRHGGHAQVSVLGSTLFGGVSGRRSGRDGSGGILVPWQIKIGYPRAFCATIAAASTIDILIPPSIPLILYSLVSNASIGALFLAGIVPGLLLAVGSLWSATSALAYGAFPTTSRRFRGVAWLPEASTLCPLC